MQNGGFKTALRLMAILAVMAGMLTILGCPSDEEAEVQVAASNAVIPANATTVRAIEGQTFSFPNGAAALAGLAPELATQPVTLAFSNTAAATPTFTLTSAGRTATGTTRFGSCTFTVTSSNIPGVNVGEQLTVNVCQVNAQTGGVQATGQATTVQILLQLGITPSQANQASVSIDPNSGVVTINNVNTGVSVTLVVQTGAAGG